MYKAGMSTSAVQIIIERDDVRDGRVEICNNGIWRSVCANGWDDVDADACSQLGYGKYGKNVH